MQNIIVLISLMLSAFSMSAQSRVAWPKTTRPCDNIIDSLENSSGNISVKQIRWIGELYKLAEQHPQIKAIKWRALYWDAVINNDRKNNDKAKKLIKEAEKTVDKRNYEYDYHRIVRSRRIIENTEKQSMYKLYVAQHEDMEFFKSVSDSKTLASCYLTMGNIFLNLREPLQALNFFKKAKQLYREAGNNTLLTSIDINEALCNIEMGNVPKAQKILYALEKSSLASKDTIFHLKVLLNISYSFAQDNKPCPQKYIEQMSSFAELCGNDYYKYLCRVNIGSWHFRHKHYDKALSLLLSTKNYAENSGISDWAVHYNRGIAECFYAKNKNDSAARYYSLFTSTIDSMEVNEAKSKIMREDELCQIKQYEEAKKREKEEMRNRLIFVIAGAVTVSIGLVCVCLFYWNKHKRTKIQLEDEQQKSERRKEELEKRNRQLAANTIVMEERDNTLRSIRSCVDDARTRNEINSSIANKIDTQVKMHLGMDKGWDTFKETLENVYPQFYIRIKQAHPQLTEYDIRLCTYLMIGIDRKQIAQMLNVQPDSLKKSCQRLRKKLEIASDTDLSSYLQSFNRQ